MIASIPFQQPCATSANRTGSTTSPSNSWTIAAPAKPSPKNPNTNTAITRKVSRMSDNVDLAVARG